MANPKLNGAFVPTTDVWDVAQLEDIDVTSPEFKELLVRLYQNINNIALILNMKDTGTYSLEEFVNGQAFFPNLLLNSSTAQRAALRQVIRKVINMGALLNAAPTTVNHGITITPSTTFTRIYACASDPVGLTYIPIPDTGAFAASIVVTATQVTILPAVNLAAYTICYAILEYLQN